MAERFIMGIDPGTNFMGYAVLRSLGRSSRPELIVSGVLELGKYEDPYMKLLHIFRRAQQVIDTYHPDELAIESQFFGPNVQSMLKLGRAQGVAIVAALDRDLPIFEYAPKKVKMSVCGSGSASKEQVLAMLSKMIEMPAVSTLDESDAIAIAFCHHLQGDLPSRGSSKKQGWGAFIKENPDKIFDPNLK